MITTEQILEEELQNLRLEIKELNKKKIDIETKIGFVKLQLDRLKEKTYI